VRQRNAILETLELFRDLHPGITLGNMIAFMYTCENEGLTILDLAQVSGFYLATASRTIRAFSCPDADGAMSPLSGCTSDWANPGLVERRRHGRARLRSGGDAAFRARPSLRPTGRRTGSAVSS